MTPYHLICQATGDDDELLDLTRKSSERNLLNNKSFDGSTALLYAVNNANLNCVRCLVANGTKVTLEDSSCLECCTKQDSMRPLNLITAANKLLQDASIYPSDIVSDIFDVLLDSAIDVNTPCCMLNCQRTPIICAIIIGNVQCVKKLIENGALLHDIVFGLPVWSWITRTGSVELIECMFNHGIHMDSTTMEGRSALSFVVEGEQVEAIRYLLDLGVTMTSDTPATDTVSCKKCGIKRLLIDNAAELKNNDPFMIACRKNLSNVVQLLEKYNNQNFKTMNALRCAITSNSIDVVELLLNKYKYHLNEEYFIKDPEDPITSLMDGIKECCLLEEACGSHPAVVQLLLDHGADLNKTFCYSSGIINPAVRRQHTDVLALLIRNGAVVSSRSQSILPFEIAAIYHMKCIAKMLVISGYSCGIFSLAKDTMYKDIIPADIMILIKEWNVCENNVTPLTMQCRRMILKYLSPQSQKTIMKLPLPLLIIKYLGIPELDDIVDADA